MEQTSTTSFHVFAACQLRILLGATCAHQTSQLLILKRFGDTFGTGMFDITAPTFLSLVFTLSVHVLVF
jgi:hypothetical protein